jgi:TolB protein
MSRSRGAPAGDPYDPRAGGPRGRRGGPALDLVGLPIAPLIALVGLLVATVVTLSLTSGRLPFGVGSQGVDGPNVARTPTPSNLVVVPDDPRAHIPGTIVYAKDGNVWVQSGATAVQLTIGDADAMPSISSDGQTVYFIRTRQQHGQWPRSGAVKPYLLTIPTVMSIPTAGGTPVKLLDGIVDPPGANVWTSWIREPVVSPDGSTIALVSDLPQPGAGGLVLQLLKVATGKLTSLGLAETPPLGHQDPAWRPDGKLLLYVRDARSDDKGTPQIYAWSPATKTAKPLTGSGYLHPAWSADGRWIAATKTTAFGTDIVILDGTTGAEVLRVTSDGSSWGPAWSPKGDSIAFLHVNDQVVDLRLVMLKGVGPNWSLGDSLDLTSGAGLDSVSRPDWFIPADQLPAPTALPTALPSSTSGSGGPRPSPS